MSLIAWNARGLGDPRAFNKLRMIVRSFSPGLVFISETKLSGRRASLIKDRLGFEYGVHVDSVGRSGGLALVRTKDWDVVIQSFSRAYILMLLSPRLMAIRGGLLGSMAIRRKHRDTTAGSFYDASVGCSLYRGLWQVILMKFCTLSKGKVVVIDMIAVCEVLVKLLMTVSSLT